MKTTAQIVREQMAKWASQGGKARAKGLSPERRREIARMGAAAMKAARRKGGRS